MTMAKIKSTEWLISTKRKTLSVLLEVVLYTNANIAASINLL